MLKEFAAFGTHLTVNSIPGLFCRLFALKYPKHYCLLGALSLESLSLVSINALKGT